jgi:hypothetical protein
VLQAEILALRHQLLVLHRSSRSRNSIHVANKKRPSVVLRARTFKVRFDLLERLPLRFGKELTLFQQFPRVLGTSASPLC